MQCKHSIKKSHLAFKMTENELNKYQDLHESINDAVIKTKKRIENLGNFKKKC